MLRYLPSRLTLREIAAELSVSVNTLKFHLKVVYRKLGVGSRAEAAELARDVADRSRSGLARRAELSLPTGSPRAGWCATTRRVATIALCPPRARAFPRTPGPTR